MYIYICISLSSRGPDPNHKEFPSMLPFAAATLPKRVLDRRAGPEPNHLMAWSVSKMIPAVLQAIFNSPNSVSDRGFSIML